MLKVLIVDIETTPKRAFVWRVWKENISPAQMISDWFMISWNAKWAGEEEMFNSVMTSKEMLAQDDARILDELHPLLDEADVVVAHNGAKFDIPSINTRFIMNGFPPPSPYRQVDTLLVSRRNFNFTRNSLNYIGQALGLGAKAETGGFELWEKCYMGDEVALATMNAYNKQDVLLLERVYYALLPYIPNHPSHGVASQGFCCPKCGSDDLQKRGTTSTNVSTFQRYRCNSCGGWSRARQNLREKEEMRTTLLSV